MLIFRVRMMLKQLPFLFLLVFWILAGFIVVAVAVFVTVVWVGFCVFSLVGFCFVVDFCLLLSF